MSRTLSAAIIATTDIGKPSINAETLNRYICRKDSPLSGHIRTKVFYPLSPDRLSDISDEICGLSPDVCFFYSHSSWPENKMFSFLNEIKKRTGNVILVSARDTVCKFSKKTGTDNFIDYILLGESERNFEKILTNMLSPGYKKVENTEVLEDFGTIENLDDIPSPILDGNFRIAPGQSKMQIYLSRGCHNKCSYCSVWESKERFFSKERPLSEIKAVIEKYPSIKVFQIMTPDIFDKKINDILPHLKRLAEENEVFFSFFTHSGIRRDDKTLESANCAYFNIRAGVQSFNMQSLKSVNRIGIPEEMRKNLLRMRSLATKASLSAEFIMGLPYETEETFMEGIDWAIKNRFSIVINHLFVPPESPLGMSEIGKMIKTMDGMPYYAKSTNTLSEQDMDRITERLNRVFFILNMIKANKALADLFYILAQKTKNKMPFVNFAEILANRLLYGKETSGWAAEYLDKSDKYIFSTEGTTPFSKGNILQLLKLLKAS